MEPVQHPLCTAMIGAPSDMQDGSCRALPVAYTSDEFGTCAISFWKPEPDELATLLHGGHVALHVRTQGGRHPVVGIGAFADVNGDARGNLVRAAAQIIAEIEHLDRSEDSKKSLLPQKTTVTEG